MGTKSNFQGFWHGPALDPIQQACLRSFIERGHSYDLFTYEDVSVPSGVTLADASAIIPLDEVFYFDNPETGKKDIGPFSDLFRLKLLYELGGWWTDVDTVCVATTIPPVGRAWARECPTLEWDAVGNGQIAFEKGDPIAKLLYERCLALSRSGFQKREALGPKLLSSVIKELGLPKDMFGTPETFFPINWIETFKLWLPRFVDEMETKADKALFMPVYQSFPQYIGLTAGHLPPEDSYLGRLCARFGLDGGVHYRSEEVEEALGRFMTKHNWAIEPIRCITSDEFIDLLGIGKEARPEPSVV